MTSRRALHAAALGATLAAVALAGLTASADAPDAGAPPAPTSAVADPPPPTCVEHVPAGATRPKMTEDFPRRGTSGYAAPLTLRITHGKGETVIAEGLRVVQHGDGAKALAAAGFAIPEPDGGAGPDVKVDERANDATTTLVIHVVPLAPHAGRNEMALPPLPVTLARASGEQVTLCTKPHVIRVDEPIAGELHPKVRPNPPPRPQKEEWVLLEEVLAGVLLGLLIAGLVALALRAWRRRPRAVPPKPRPIPWLVALEELDALRRSPLLAEHKNDEYLDRVSDTIRRYLGARYHFDTLQEGWSGLETTTDEMKALLRRVRPPVEKFGEIANFLGDADLVKFAKVFPTDEECLAALGRAERIVRATIPPNHRPPGADGGRNEGGGARPPVEPRDPYAPPEAPP
ncbi:MAG TPA: hypothetical protein VHB21_08915 [Minicystis sp.]|nr:hypothetical protein [Minicystis sp.]